MKALLDLLPVVVFFAAYKFFGMYVATAVLIGALVLLVLYYRLVQGHWHKAHLFAAGVAAVLGGLTLYLHDASFIKLKPTLLYGVFALALLGSQVIGEKTLAERVAGGSLTLPRPLWRRINLAWAGFFAVCAVLNLYVAEHFSEQTWVTFKLVGFTVLPILFALAHAPFLAPYLQAQADKTPSP